MTAALTKALEKYDPQWMSAGLEASYLRTVAGVMYAVLIARSGEVVAVYRVSPRRMKVSEAVNWPRSLAEEVMSNVRSSSRTDSATSEIRKTDLPDPGERLRCV